MKKIFLLAGALTCLSFLMDSVAQEAPSTSKEHKNEIAFEVTNLVERLTGSLIQGEAEPFEVTYRRLMKKGNIRARLGFNLASYEAAFSTIPDERFTATNSMVVARLGYEWFSNMGERWQVFYGADGVFSNLVEETVLNTADLYVVRNSIQQRGVGISPFLGIRFKLHERVSLLTDINYTALIIEQKENDENIWQNPDFTQEVTLPLERIANLTEVQFTPAFYLRLAVTL